MRCKQASVSNPGLIHNSPTPPLTNLKSSNEIARLQLCQITSPLYTECRPAPNANMADHSIGAWDELHESEASQASVFCFDNAFLQKFCLFVDLVCFFSLLPRVAVFLNATRSDRSVHRWPLREKVRDEKALRRKKVFHDPDRRANY